MSTHPRILAVDIGDKFVGLAMTDGLGITVQPLFTLRRGKLKDDAKSIARTVKKHGIEEIVAGLPLHMEGQEGKQAVVAREFAEAVAQVTGLGVHFFDERLTTREAHHRLNEAEYGTKDRKKVLDQVAAVVLLESYLAERAYREARESR